MQKFVGRPVSYLGSGNEKLSAAYNYKEKMKDNKNIIPSAILEDWEREAIEQKIPYTEFGSFLKMKEQNYWQNLITTKERPAIFANDARNKLTDYGQKVALETLLSIPRFISEFC